MLVKLFKNYAESCADYMTVILRSSKQSFVYCMNKIDIFHLFATHEIIFYRCNVQFKDIFSMIYGNYFY